MNQRYLRHLWKDMFVLSGGVAVAVLLVQLGIIGWFLSVTANTRILASFISGMFFTSVLTIAPASVALIGVASAIPPIDVAFWGAFGALIVDAFLLNFVKKDISRDIRGAFSPALRHRILPLLHFGFIKWFFVITGALVIASPFPDEIGLMLLGFSRVPTKYLFPIIFAMNFMGIWLLTSVAQALL